MIAMTKLVSERRDVIQRPAIRHEDSCLTRKRERRTEAARTLSRAILSFDPTLLERVHRERRKLRTEALELLND
ncbi:hypothetical protein D3C85_1120410 [compost metagenome]